MADAQDALIVPTFKNHAVINDAKTREQGRPIYDDVEICEIRMAANRQTVGVFPAHEVWQWVDNPDGSREPQTYAMRFPEQYKQFKNNETQARSGTPIEELPFLTQGKRYELKALNIHTAETLAALDGQPLKQLGVGGRDLKNQAQAYLDSAKQTASLSHKDAEIEKLKKQIADLQEDKPKKSTSPFDDMDDDSIKEWIADATGSKPRGNPSHETLVRMADEVNAEIASKKSK